MNSKHLSRLLSLEAKIDVVNFGVYRGEDGKFYKEDGTPATGAGDFKTVAGAVGAVGAAGAGLAAHGAVMRNYGGAGGAKQAYRNLGRNAVAAPLHAAVSGLKSAGARVDAAGSVFKKAKASTPFLSTLKTAGKALLRRPILASSIDRLVELDSKLHDLKLEAK